MTTDANNMYLEGKAGARGWEGAATSVVADNANTMPDVGSTVELPVEHRSFEPDLSVRDLKPVEFPGISTDSSASDVQAAVDWVTEQAGWFHSIDLPQGISTPGSRGWAHRAERFGTADIVAGKRVLDIGSMEGGDVFVAEDAGAASVTAFDVDNYFGYDLGRNAAWDFVVEKYEAARAAGPDAEWAFLNSKRFGFELCRAARGSNATRVSGSVYELDPAIHGVFDVTMCFGLMYHLRHPLLALDRIAAVTGKVLLINNQVFAGTCPEPNAVLFFNDTWRGSYTNWFVPGWEAFIGMLSSSGFRKLEVVDRHDTSISVACYR